jgi:polysaccharide export outer membrane protein
MLISSNRIFSRGRQWLSGLLIAVILPAPCLAQSVPDENYLIGPGDHLQVVVWREAELSVDVPVRPDGRISTPLVEDMMAIGKTSSQLARDIEEVLSEFYQSPTVTILVQSFVGTFQSQVTVLGAVASPGSYPYREGMTVLNVLIEAGGLTQFARGKKGQLNRGEGSEREEFKLRLDRLMEKGDLEENMDLQPGDIIVVPQAIF